MGQLRFLHDPKLRAVAVADPALGTARARTGAVPLYGGSSALKHALEETMATAVLLVGRAGKGHPHLTSHLETHGGVDAYSLRVTVEPVRAPPPVSDDWKRS